MKMYQLTQEQIQLLVDTLSKQPYASVYIAMDLLRGLKPLEDKIKGEK